jgi:transcriptional regulator with XRE-family HTH domain
MTLPRQFVQIRTKKLALLIFDARKAQRRTVEECAEAIGVSPEQFQEYEKGSRGPSLPQLELLALYMNLPVEHFWGKQAISEIEVPQALVEKERLLQLRNRMVGTQLRLARNTANFSYQEMFDRAGITEEELRTYETGETPIPVPVLESLCNILDLPIERFYDQAGPIGKWRTQQGTVQMFLELPPEVQQFVCKPVNRPYLELAMRLSELNAEKLRAVAEVLLEITY